MSRLSHLLSCPFEAQCMVLGSINGELIPPKLPQILYAPLGTPLTTTYGAALRYRREFQVGCISGGGASTAWDRVTDSRCARHFAALACCSHAPSQAAAVGCRRFADVLICVDSRRHGRSSGHDGAVGAVLYCTVLDAAASKGHRSLRTAAPPRRRK